MYIDTEVAIPRVIKLIYPVANPSLLYVEKPFLSFSDLAALTDKSEI